MAVRAGGVTFLILLALALLWRPQPVASCGPFFTNYVFTPAQALSLKDAAAGRWDILQPSYRHASLILAYRYLSGVRLTPEELQAIAPAPRVATPEEQREGWPPGVNTWLEARKMVPSAAPVRQVDVFRQAADYRGVHNCLPDSFRSAARTLADRVQRFGANSREAAEWLSAQDQVFRNCSDAAAGVPPPAPAGMHPLIRADRAYQIAAAYFYAGDLDEAARRFQQIEQDAASPWSGIAPYLVARCRIRQGTGFPAPVPEAGARQLAEAESQLLKVINDPSRKAWHDSARGLLGFVRARLRPEERRVELSALLSKPAPPGELPGALEDYHYLLDRLPAGYAATDDMTDWVLTVKTDGRAALEHSVGRWRAAGSLPWLVASMIKAPAGSPYAAELLAAAARVPRDSPGYPTLAFHGIRLMEGSGRVEQARQRLDRLLSAEAKDFTAGARNLFKAQRMKLARNLDEWLRDAPREVAGVAFDDGYEGPPSTAGDPSVLFDSDSAGVLNQALPLRLLEQSAASARLPKPLRRDVALAAWVRAALLEDHEAAGRLAAAAAELAPELGPRFQAYRQAGDKRFAAAHLMLQTPGLRPFVASVQQRRTQDPAEIDSIRDNWWCPLGQGQDASRFGWDYYQMCCEVSPALRGIGYGAEPSYPAFLSPEERDAAAAEWSRIKMTGAAPSYLARQVIEFARLHPDDPRVPEALHLAVRATRYGCTDENNGKYSKQAFDLLHRRYPKSPWTAKTRYWFD